MRRPWRPRAVGIRSIAAVLAIAAVLVIAACTGQGQVGPTDTAAIATAPEATAGGSAGVTTGPAIPVLGTENFYADLLTRVGGSRVSATSLLNDPNADPHAFDASPRAATAVSDARLVVVNGIGYDDFMQRLLGASGRRDRVVINVQDLLGLSGDVNAHVWYDPRTMPRVADAVADALSRLEPQNSAYFVSQKAGYLATLKPFSDKVAALKAKYSGTPIACTEPVAEYLTDAIGLTVLTPKSFQEAIEQGVDPSPADVAAERDLLTKKKVKALLYNSQVTSPLTDDIRDLAVRSGVPVVGVAETTPPSFKAYPDWMLAQLDALERALGG